MKKLVLAGMLLLAVTDVRPMPLAPAAERMYRASRIVGSAVRDRQDRRIGEIKDLILGSARGDIAYAVLGFGGDTRYHAVPWKALQPGDDGTYYTLSADSETIGNAPGFERGNWPDLAEQQWRAEVDRYWARMVGHGTADVNRLSSGVSGSNSAQGPDTGAGR